jgi:hypothetical protein
MQQNQSVSFFAPGFDDQLEQQKLERQRKLAEAMAAQSQTPLKGGMAGQVYVPPSITQGMAQLLQGYGAGKMRQDADQKQDALVKAMQTRNQQEMGGFAEALRGKPAREGFQTGANEMGDEPAMQQPTPATPGDPQKALALALQARNPALQQWGMSQLIPKTPKWEKAERPQADGSKQSGFVDVNSPDPWSTFKLGGTAPGQTTAINGQLVNSATATPVGASVPKQADAPNAAKDLLIPDGSGGWKVNTALVGAKKDIAKSGASNTQVSVNTATKPFLNKIGEGVGEQVVKDFEGARSAQQVLNNVGQIEAGLKNVIVGPTATARVKLSQIGQLLGVNGKDATEQLQNTRMVMQGLARQELSAAAGMKGQGQITENEREILRKAEAGKFEEMTVPEIQSLLGALRKTSQYRMSVHGQNMERLKKDPNAAGVVEYMTLPTVPGSAGGSVLDAADAILSGGK